jgi:acetoin utilization deacetylase AcuC-like enzyme
MKVFYHDVFRIPLPEGHRFPEDKYSMLRQQLLAQEVVQPHEMCLAGSASDEQLLLAHTADYIEKVKLGRLSEQETRRTGFPWSPELVERSRRSVGATIAACRTAWQAGIAANLGGGTHHAHHAHGEGFCVFNDVAVAARVMQTEGHFRRALVVDCDVHQGDGTAAIFVDDPSVFTFSIHGQKNFPFRKQPSDLDIGLADRTDDQAYLAALQQGLAQALQQAQAEMVFYVAGADPYQDDQLGRLALTKAGLLERDRLVFNACQQAGLPVTLVMGGGYARQIADTVSIHIQTFQIAAAFWRRV